ncbi:MAG: hypothetical protein EB101_05800, partial [Chitinophagia bacterium]|nr:hypothetical protein [Chitinophagia bacterium]
PSAKHRAEIRNAIAPLQRWERPQRPYQRYIFPYANRDGSTVLEVVRDDSSGKKNIRQQYPTIPPDAQKRKKVIDEIRTNILPYRYQEALDFSKEKNLPIFVVEGELCCDKLWQIGLPAVTFLGGSGQYRSNGDYSLLFRQHQLVLCPDRDEPGVALMREVAADNPGSQWLYAEPDSFEWESLPQNGGYDMADWLDDGADQELILASIVFKDKHEGRDGRPSFEEIIATFERMVGLYNNDARVVFEAREWLTLHEVKMPATEVEKLLAEARSRVHGREEMEVMDAKTIAMSEDSRAWTIAGILPESSVMLLAAAPGSGKSTLLYNWALHVATGSPWSRRRCKKGKSLIIQCDEPVVDAAEKMQIIGYDDNENLDKGDIGFIDRWRFNNIPQLLSYIKKHRPQLIMIDSLTSCLAGMDVDLIRSDAGNCIYELRDIANEYQCSIVILHHLNKSGGIRDSSSFEANVSEVVKLYRQDNNYDTTQFIFEWTKSRSGLAGKHFLRRDPATYGWFYEGPVNGGRDDLDRLVQAVDTQPTRRFDRMALSRHVSSFDSNLAGRLAEQARRQGLLTSSFNVGPNGERTRLYQSWNYKEEDFTVSAAAEPIVEEDDIWF